MYDFLWNKKEMIKKFIFCIYIVCYVRKTTQNACSKDFEDEFRQNIVSCFKQVVLILHFNGHRILYHFRVLLNSRVIFYIKNKNLSFI